MATKMLHKKDIISIIQSCQKYGVSSFKFDGLELTFHSQNFVPTVITRTNKQNATAKTVQSELLDDASLNTLAITDPVAYEQHLIDRAARETQ